MNNKTKAITTTAMLSALSGILMLMEFPIPIFPSFLKVDFSDLPALLAAFLINPLSGVLVVFLKNIINIIFTGTATGYIGEMANFIIGTAFVLPAGLIYRRSKTRAGAVKAMLAGIFSMAVVGGLTNYYILIPLFTKFIPLDAIIEACNSIIPFVDSFEKVIIFSVIPFNLLKGIMASLLALLIYKRLSHIFKNF